MRKSGLKKSVEWAKPRSVGCGGGERPPGGTPKWGGGAPQNGGTPQNKADIPPQGCDHHRQGNGEDLQAGSFLHPGTGLRRHGLPGGTWGALGGQRGSFGVTLNPLFLVCVCVPPPDKICAVPRRRAAEAEGSGAHSVAARDRCHQQPHPGLPRAFFGYAPRLPPNCPPKLPPNCPPTAPGSPKLPHSQAEASLCRSWVHLACPTTILLPHNYPPHPTTAP